MQDFEGESQPQNPEFKINPENFHPYYVLFICLFEVYVPVNSYGHVEMVSLPNHTFSRASLTKWLTSTSCTYFNLYLITTILESVEGGE